MQKRYQNNVYYVNTLRGIRFLVLGLIGAAALSLMTQDSFFDWSSWVIFGMVFVLGILPQLVSKNCVRTHKVVTWLSNPILLILMAGVAGYLLY
jgi:chromate transport protein ChrA